jgi:phosphatidylglycerol:prolipoprotein diacylglycerol transferase
VPWGVIFPGLDLVPRHPTQLYSALLSLGLFAYLLRLYPRRRFEGQVFLTYIIGYALLRFAVEFFRENLIVAAGFSIAQVVAAGILIIAVVFYWHRSRNATGPDVLRGD